MTKPLMLALWACLVTLGSTYAGMQWRLHRSAPQAEHAEKATIHKVRPITVPIIANGALKGYVSAEFNFVGADENGHDGEAEAESFFMDEAFRLIYSDTTIDFTDLRKSDLSALTVRLTENVNKRIGRSAVKETLLRNFNFVSRDDMPR